MLETDKVEFVPVATTDELGNGQRILVDIGDVSVAVFNIAGAYFAIADICSHDGGAPAASSTWPAARPRGLRRSRTSRPIQCESRAIRFWSACRSNRSALLISPATPGLVNRAWRA